MGKASRAKRVRLSQPAETHEPDEPQNWPGGHVSVEITDARSLECFAVTIHGVVHYLHATTAQALHEALTRGLVEWDRTAKMAGTPGVLPEPSPEGSEVFDSTKITTELAEARESGRQMVRGALKALRNEGPIFEAHLPFLGFVERAQAFHQGVVDMVEAGNPLAAITLLRSFAENVAAVYYVDKHPQEFEKLRPGAKQRLPMGKVIAEAERHLPGFKQLYDHWSSVAHPSGAGAFHTLRVSESHQFTWQSHPTFHHLDDARRTLRWLDELRGIAALIIDRTAEVAGEAVDRHRGSRPRKSPESIT